MNDYEMFKYLLDKVGTKYNDEPSRVVEGSREIWFEGCYATGQAVFDKDGQITQLDAYS